MAVILRFKNNKAKGKIGGSIFAVIKSGGKYHLSFKDEPVINESSMVDEFAGNDNDILLFDGAWKIRLSNGQVVCLNNPHAPKSDSERQEIERKVIIGLSCEHNQNGRCSLTSHRECSMKGCRGMAIVGDECPAGLF